MERAKYHLDRLLVGPTQTGSLEVKAVHRRSLESSITDLVALREEAVTLLADDRLRARLQEQYLRNIDPWHSILQVLKALDGVPGEVMRAWTEPALQTSIPLLRREAARALSTAVDEDAARLLLAFLQEDGADRDIARVTLATLLPLGPHWARAALEAVLQSGGPRAWESLADRLASTVPAQQHDAATASLLAWWAALAQGSGPRIDLDIPHIKDFPWATLRLALDDRLTRRKVPARHAQGEPGPHASWFVQGPLDLWQAYGTGWLSCDPSKLQVQPVFCLYLMGSEPSARARCILGLWGHEPYLASVIADRELKGSDDAVYFASLHCMGIADEATGDVLGELEEQLQRLAAHEDVDAALLSRLLMGVPPCDADPRARALLLRTLTVARPIDKYMGLFEAAYEALSRCHVERRDAVVALLGATDPEDRGAGMHLARRARDPEYLDAVEALLARAEPSLVATVQRLLLFLYARTYPIAPERQERFVRLAESWLGDANESETTALAAGLLDLGPEGEAAFARGLADPTKRRLLLGALPDDGRVVGPRIADALLDALDDSSPREELWHVLNFGYTSFPLQSASALQALSDRLSPATKGWAATVLERVRYRPAR